MLAVSSLISHRQQLSSEEGLSCHSRYKFNSVKHLKPLVLLFVRMIVEPRVSSRNGQNRTLRVLALTYLDECVMNANAAIARRE